MLNKIFTIGMFACLLLISCKNSSAGKKLSNDVIITNADSSATDSAIVYQTENLIIQQLSERVYQHISFINTNDFGRVSCNGMIAVYDREAIVFDTPTDDVGSGELIQFIADTLQCKIKAIIPTHFHDDCVGGLEKFMDSGIPVHATGKTIALLQNKGKHFSKPMQPFSDSLTLTIGEQKVHAEYFGEGHTKDNVIGYFPADNAIFGGCLIKETGAGNGNLEDANTKAWSATVRKIKSKYPKASIVIPGHGKAGGTELLDYTIHLFDKSTGL